MGYSAALVPFSSFLRGFLGVDGGAGEAGDGEGHPLIINAGGRDALPVSPPGSVLVSILGPLGSGAAAVGAAEA